MIEILYSKCWQKKDHVHLEVFENGKRLQLPVDDELFDGWCLK